MCNGCYDQAESRGDTHCQELWTTGQGLLVSIAFVIMVLTVFFTAIGGLS